jgi:hypothetical protein
MSLLAQQTATLSGTLTDSTGALVEGASVTLRNTGSNEIRQSLTDSTGRYTFTLLQAGTFEVTGDKAGFKESTRPGINLAVGQSAVVNLQLMPGPASEQVFVNGDASQIGATLNETSGLITGEQVRNLPLNGRSYDELITLNPGSLNYTSQRTGGVGTSNSAVGNMFAISGRRPQENLFLLDGVEYTGASGLNQTPGGTSGLLLGVDSLREFNVLTRKISERLSFQLRGDAFNVLKSHEPQHSELDSLLVGDRSAIKYRRRSYQHFDDFAAAAGFGEVYLVIDGRCALAPGMCFRRPPEKP